MEDGLKGERQAPARGCGLNLPWEWSGGLHGSKNGDDESHEETFIS